MAAPLVVQPITSAAVAVNGTPLHGLVKEIAIDPIKFVTQDFMSLGMVGVQEVVVGVEKMSGTMKLTTANAQLMAKLAGFGANVPMSISCNKDTVGGPTVVKSKILWNMTISSKGSPSGLNIKAQEMAEFDYEFSISSLEMIDNGVSIYKFVVGSNILESNGADQLATFRNNLGL